MQNYANFTAIVVSLKYTKENVSFTHGTNSVATRFIDKVASSTLTVAHRCRSQSETDIYTSATIYSLPPPSYYSDYLEFEWLREIRLSVMNSEKILPILYEMAKIQVLHVVGY
jgi:hypothetical protein